MKMLGWLRSARRLRLASGCLLVLLAFAGAVDSLGLDACSHHGLPGQTASASAEASPESAGAGQGHHAAHGAASSTDDERDKPGSGCTCIGDCAGTAIIAATTTPTILDTTDAHFADVTAWHDAERALRSRYLDMIPYSNAPPIVRSTV